LWSCNVTSNLRDTRNDDVSFKVSEVELAERLNIDSTEYVLLTQESSY